METFYISSTDYPDLGETRTCIDPQVIRLGKKIGLVANADKPIFIPEFNKYFEVLYIIGRFRGSDLSKPSQSPVDVHVLVHNDDLRLNDIDVEDLYHLAWARLYTSKVDADRKLVA